MYREQREWRVVIAGLLCCLCAGCPAPQPGSDLGGGVELGDGADLAGAECAGPRRSDEIVPDCDG